MIQNSNLFCFLAAMYSLHLKKQIVIAFKIYQKTSYPTLFKKYMTM